jgi:formylglycine-generating enzyme required for sulfatase activity
LTRSSCLLLLAAGLLAACGAPPTAPDAGPDAGPADYTESIRGSEVAFDMVWVPEGGFWIGRTEVTWDEFLLYCDFEQTGQPAPGADAVSKPSKPLDWTPYDHDWGVGRRPAVGMSWNSAQKYCQWLSLNTGVEYRLPTEEEWALACGRGGRGPLAERAWYAANSGDMTQEVGGRAPNERGLHDMLGNLWEYCAGPFSPSEPECAVLRGGSWREEADEVRPDARLGFEEDWTLEDPNFPPGVWWVPDGDHLGLRVVRSGPKS